MARKMSNRERIDRLAAEKAAEAEEKATKKKTTKKKATTTKKKTAKKVAKASVSGMRKVWKVYDSAFREVEMFTYPEKDKAEKRAKELSEKTGKDHFVNAAEVPME